MLTVKLDYADGHQEFLRPAYIVGIRDGKLLVAEGMPVGGLDAPIVREVDVSELKMALTLPAPPSPDEDPEAGAQWSMSWDD